MAFRYEEATDDVGHLLQKLRSEYFPELTRARIKLLFDLKKRSSKNRLILARIIAPTDLLKYLTREESRQLDYIIAIDKHAWEILDDTDRTRILRHELRHAFVEAESPEPFKLIDHTIQDFEVEMKLNEDDPQWVNRVARKVAAAYTGNTQAAERARRPSTASTAHAFSLPRASGNRGRTKKVAKPIAEQPIKERLRYDPVKDDVWWVPKKGRLLDLKRLDDQEDPERRQKNNYLLAYIIRRLDEANLQSWLPYKTVRNIAIQRGVIGG